MTPAIPPDAKRVVLAAVVSCPTCEGSLSVGEPGYTYYGIPEPGSYEACPDCMDDHGIPTGTRTVITDIEVVPVRHWCGEGYNFYSAEEKCEPDQADYWKPVNR